jgi:peptidoglycan hydrolase CwlO-like protein
MTAEDPKAQIQKLNDMLQMLSNQRNSAQNECVQLGAEIIALQREIAELKKAKEETAVPARSTNGHGYKDPYVAEYVAAP